MGIVGRREEWSKILSIKLYILFFPNSILEFAASKLSSIIWHSITLSNSRTRTFYEICVMIDVNVEKSFEIDGIFQEGVMRE